MKLLVMFSILLIILSSNVVFAQAGVIIDINDVKYDFESNSDLIPGIVRSFLGDEIINIYYVNSQKEEVRFYAIFRNGILNEIGKGNMGGSSLNLYLGKEDLEDIIKAKDMKKEIKRKLETGEIFYEANNAITKIKIKIIQDFL
ncbi:hypothetical protein J4216_02665 [Candidatus Woesearchaeota archaeon]|nr:hypothetical protein [Candidatus Woesearchaeota archaeon]